jgi:uncharacterized protein involved in type VI secretion and phage assembly
MSAALPAIATAVSAISPAPVVYLHVALFLAEGRIVGDESFRLVNFQGQESISEHFEFQLELHGNTSPSHGTPLAFDNVVGRPVTVGVHYPAMDGMGRQPTRAEANQWFQSALKGSDESSRLAFFNGVIATFSMEQPGVYRITMRPALWKLTLTNAYCIHPQMSVRDVLDAVLKRHGISYSVDALVGSDNLAVTRVQDWLQAGESDYDFLKRLMSKAHIYYFFATTAVAHTVVFANRPAYPQAMPGGKPLRYCSTAENELGLAQPDVISDYQFQQSLSSSGVNTVFTREEAAWEVDPVAGFHSFRASTKSEPGELPFHQYMIYQYGCSDAEVDHFASNTQSSLTTSSRELGGSSYCPYMRCGHQFTVTQNPRAGQWPQQVRPALEGTAWTATQVEHQASLDGTYENKFRSADAKGLVTPFSLQETQQGAVLARVAAYSAGTAAPTDWRFYEKTSFDPEVRSLTDSDGTQTELSAQGVCVVFSSDPDDAAPVWVKLAPHMQAVPEIGAMVMVSRAQDQSELPEIQSIVAANGTKVVKPSGWTANTNVGSGYSTNYGDGLSIHFGLHSQADLPKATGIVLGQYAGGQFRDASYSQGASYSYATSESGAAGLLSTSDSYGSAYSTHHGAISSSTTVFDNTSNNSVVTQTATSVTTVEGLSSNTSTQALVQSTSTTGGSQSLETVGAHAGLTATGVSATASLTGVRVQGSMEGVSTSSSLVGEATSNSVTGVSTQVNATGTSTSVNVTGASSHTAMTGAEMGINLVGTSSNTSLTGAAVSMSLMGSHTDMSLTGTSTRMSVTGESSNISVLGSSTDISMSGSTTNLSIKGSSTSIDITGAGISVQLAAAMASMHITGMSLDIVELKIYL